MYSLASSGDHGTLYQLRNRLNRTNVVSNPTSDFNACDDFFVLVVTSHVVTAALEVIKDMPHLDTAWMHTPEQRKSCLHEVCSKIVDNFINFSYHKVPSVSEDRIFTYATEIISTGCFYLEFADAIREGDGNRILRCWRYLLPIFKFSNRTNYANEVLNMLLQHHFTLSPRHAQQLIWSRCVNVHGFTGRNIPADLHMEHLNRLAKEAIRGLGPNKTETAIGRVGQALGTIAPVLDQFDSECGVSDVSGSHTTATTERDVSIIVSQLLQSEVFTTKTNRKHYAFPTIHRLLYAKDKILGITKTSSFI